MFVLFCCDDKLIFIVQLRPSNMLLSSYYLVKFLFLGVICFTAVSTIAFKFRVGFICSCHSAWRDRVLS